MVCAAVSISHVPTPLSQAPSMVPTLHSHRESIVEPRQQVRSSGFVQWWSLSLVQPTTVGDTRVWIVCLCLFFNANDETYPTTLLYTWNTWEKKTFAKVLLRSKAPNTTKKMIDNAVIETHGRLAERTADSWRTPIFDSSVMVPTWVLMQLWTDIVLFPTERLPQCILAGNTLKLTIYTS